ncbi:hypothetical protein GQ53DRAFT_763853 [Thozetella sp. PMI_491]|nr:hypothetical protein GQ53DRAFT_763853 [Thozetella sp. PMI_491]
MAASTPSPLYNKLAALAQTHARPPTLEMILLIRSPTAIHAWGHSYLVSRNPKMQERMDNAAFKSHLQTTGPYFDHPKCSSEVHDIHVDEYKRKATIHMSYYQSILGSDEKVVQDLIWVLTFTAPDEAETERGDLEGIKIQESVEFVDAAASHRLTKLVRGVHGEIREDARGGVTIVNVD